MDLSMLEEDPYPFYSRLRASGALSWVEPLGMWWVTDHAMCRQVLADQETFTTDWPQSLIYQTFGAQMLTTGGDVHRRYRASAQAAFMPRAIRDHLETGIADAVHVLIAGMADGPVELRSAFASRLPVLTILLAFGLPFEAEARLRHWYDRFEAALANFAGDQAVRSAASACVTEFHDWMAMEMARVRAGAPNTRLLGSMLQSGLSDDEIRRNMLITFFGGISTVEALILNAVWALAHHPEAQARVRAQLTLMSAVVEETMRWLAPVQSATRQVTQQTTLAGVTLPKGAIVNCMLGAANHDPAVFPDPERFDIDRPNLAQHLGFATGPHMCIGFRLARAEASLALGALFRRFPHFEIDPDESCRPTGLEFRQPRRLTLRR